MNLKVIMLSESSQTEKEHILRASIYIELKKCKLIPSDRKQIRGCQGVGLWGAVGGRIYRES